MAVQEAAGVFSLPGKSVGAVKIHTGSGGTARQRHCLCHLNPSGILLSSHCGWTLNI